MPLQVELLFKGLKECGCLHQLPSRDESIVKVLIMAALCWMCLAGLLHHVLIRAGRGRLAHSSNPAGVGR